MIFNLLLRECLYKSSLLNYYEKQNVRGNTMFGLKRLGKKTIKVLRAKNDNNAEISFFDVKEMYEAAYAEKKKARVNIKRFKKLMAKATLMDMAYRSQLTKAQPFQYGRAA